MKKKTIKNKLHISMKGFHYILLIVGCFLLSPSWVLTKAQEVRPKKKRVTVSLPKFDTFSREFRGMDYSDITEDKENKYDASKDNQEITAIPLKSQEELGARIVYVEDGESTVEYTKALAKLFIRRNGGKTNNSIITYLPQKQYWDDNKHILDKMGFYIPAHCGYSGITILSTKRGGIVLGYIWENGRPIEKLIPRKLNSNIQTIILKGEDRDINLIINIYAQSKEANYRELKK